MLKSDWRVLLLVALPCCVSLWAGFFIDDYVLMEIAQNARWDASLVACNFDIKATDLTDGWLPGFLQDFRLTFFRPGVIALFKLDWSLYGLHSWGYHLTNVLLHLAMTYSVIKLVRPWLDSDVSARLVGLIFGLLPNSMGAVIWIAARTSLMDSLLVVWSYLAFRRFHRTASPGWAAGALLALVGALLCKESALIAPLLIALCLPKRPWTRPLLWVMAAVVLLYLCGRAWIWGWGSFVMLPAYERPADLLVLLRFGWTKVVETFLSLTLQFPAIDVLHQRVLRSDMAVAVLSVLAVLVGWRLWRRLRRHHAAWWVLAWCVLACLITFPAPPLVHYLYLAQVGAAVVFVIFWQARDGDRRWRINLGRGIWWLLIVVGSLCYVGVSVGSRLQHVMVTAARQRMTAAAEGLKPGGTLGLVDVHVFEMNLAPAFRLESGRGDVKVAALCPANTFTPPRPSVIKRIDEHTIRLQADGPPYLTTPVEDALLWWAEIPELAAGMYADWPDPAYRLTVVEVGPPRPGRHRGVTELEYRFAEPIDGRHVAIVRCLEGWELASWLLRGRARLGEKGEIE